MLAKKTTINLFSLRTLFFLVVILSTGLFLGCSAEVNGPDVTFPGGGFNFFEWEFTASKTFASQHAVQSASRINVDAINGEVMISGQPGVELVSVTADLYAGADRWEDAESAIADLKVQVTDLADEIIVQTVHPESTGRRMYRVEYHIMVPEDFEVLVTQVNGRIEISDIHNSVEVSNVNGDLLLTGIDGGVTADIDNGSIEGDVILPLNQAIDWDVNNGRLELHIPASTSAELSAAISGSGTIRISHLDVKQSVNTLKSQSGRLGTGQGSITLSTINGDIEIIGFD